MTSIYLSFPLEHYKWTLVLQTDNTEVHRGTYTNPSTTHTLL